LKRILALAGILALVGVLAVPMPAFAADDTDTTTASGNPTAAIETTITGSISGMTLTVGGTNEDTTSVDMNVKCNTGTWTVKVKEVVDGNNAADGKMASYNGTAYVSGGEVLANAIKVKSSVTNTYVDLSDTAQTIESGSATLPAGNDYDIGIKQVIVYGDKVLTSPNVYRITITFESNLPA